MSEHVLKLIDELKAEVSEAEEAVKPKKILANQLCERANIALAYPDVNSEKASPVNAIRRNAFYGKALSTCIREFLEMRANLAIREATLDEIFEALKIGGYDLKTSGPTEDDQKRGIAIAMGKNSQTFHRVFSGDYGLLAWYPNIKERKPRNGDAAKAGESAKVEQPPATPVPASAPKEFSTEGMPE
jgi:hypothetical protein